MKLFSDRSRSRMTYPTIIYSVVATLTLLHSDVYGDIFITAVESESETTISWTGSLDLTNFKPTGSGVGPMGSIFPQTGMLSGSSKEEMDVYQFHHLQLRPFGKGSGKLQTSSSGDCLLLTNTVGSGGICICLPKGYSGGNISGAVTFAGSLKSLGIDSKPFSYDLGGQSISFFHTPSSFSKSTEKRPASMFAKVLPVRKKSIQLNSFVHSGKPRSRHWRFSKSEVPSVMVRPLR